VRAGSADRGRFSAKLKGLITGGPYDIQVRIVTRGGKVVESVVISDVLVGDVWILAGQSNMEGIGSLTPAIRTDKFVRAFYMDDRWGPAKDPIHNIENAVDRIHADLGVNDRKKDKRRGPGVSFGHQMRRLTGIPQGLIACAHGGSRMDQWAPSKKRRGSGSLFGDLHCH
jgi:sialate O-acetylesterase